MLTKTELILLMAIFNESLHKAVISKNVKLINEILKKRYSGQYIEGEYNIEEVYTMFQKQLEEDNLEWALWNMLTFIKKRIVEPLITPTNKLFSGGNSISTLQVQSLDILTDLSTYVINIMTENLITWLSK